MAKWVKLDEVMDALLHEQYGYLCEEAIKTIPVIEIPLCRCAECVYWCDNPEYCVFFEFPTAEYDYCSRGVNKR